MASQGDKISRKTNEAITHKWGLLDNDVFAGGKIGTSTLTIYDEADVSFATPTITEPITGIYEATFTPDAAGQWTAKLVETSLPAAAAWTFDVVANVLGDRLPDTLSLTAIDTQVDTALANIRLDELVSINAANPTAGSYLGLILNPATGVPFDRNFGSLTAIAERRTLLPNAKDFAQVLTIAGSTSSQIKTDAVGADDFWNGHYLLVHDSALGSGGGRITDFVDVDGVFTITPALPFTPGTGMRCYVIAVPEVDLVDGSIQTTTFGSGAINAAAIATNAITSNELGTTAAQKIRDEIISDATPFQGADIAAILADTAAMQPTIATNLDGTVSSRASQATADAIEVDTQDIQGRLPATLSTGRMRSQVEGMDANTITATAIAAAAISAAKFAAGAIDATAIATDAVTATKIATNAIGGPELDATAVDKIRDAILADATTFNGADIAAILADTAAIQPTVATNLDAAVSSRSSHSAADVDTTLTAAHGAGAWTTGTGTSTLTAAEVLTQVNAALDTAIAELAQAAPTATPNLRTGLMLLYMALRNQTLVSTSGADELRISNDAGTVIAKKPLTDDGSDYTEGEMVSGP
jgi:hypothetical protein